MREAEAFLPPDERHARRVSFPLSVSGERFPFPKAGHAVGWHSNLRVVLFVV
jgi:hypothetical protein